MDKNKINVGIQKLIAITLVAVFTLIAVSGLGMTLAATSEDYIVDAEWYGAGGSSKAGVSIKSSNIPENHTFTLVFFNDNQATGDKISVPINTEVKIANSNGYDNATLYLYDANNKIVEAYAISNVSILPAGVTVSVVDCTTVEVIVTGYAERIDSLIIYVNGEEYSSFRFSPGGEYVGNITVPEASEVSAIAFASDTGSKTKPSNTVTTPSCPLKDRVVVKYQDTDGNALVKDVILQGKIGEEYTTEEKLFDGYRLKSIEGNASGNFTEEIQEVVYIYNKIKLPEGPTEETPTTDKPIKPTEPTSSHITTDVTTSSSTSTPNTGDTINIVFLSLLVLTSLGSTMVIVHKRKKQIDLS